jgi:DNA-binding NarL/FixJ family response regulator
MFAAVAFAALLRIEVNGPIYQRNMQMPGGSGIDVLESMKKDGLISTVIVLTNHPYALYRKKCLQVGAKFFLDKSNEFEKVGEVLQGLIRDADRQAE